MDAGNLLTEHPDDVDGVGEEVVELLDLGSLVRHQGVLRVEVVGGNELKRKFGNFENSFFYFLDKIFQLDPILF